MSSPFLQTKHVIVDAPAPDVTLDNPVGNWSLLLVFGVSDNTSSDSFVPYDNNLNSWSAEAIGVAHGGFPSSFPGWVPVWYAKRCAPGMTTISFPFFVAGDTICIYEIGGYADLDALNFLAADPLTIDTGDIVLSFFTGFHGNTTAGWGAGTESILIEMFEGQTNTYGTFPVLTEYQIATAPGNYTSTITLPPITLGTSVQTDLAFRPIIFYP